MSGNSFEKGYIGGMEPWSLPAAIISSWLIVIAIGVGSKLAKKEIETGVEPKAATPFVFGCIALFGVMWALEERHTVIYNITSDLLGALIGLGSAYFGLRLVAALRPEPAQQQEPHQ